MNQAVEYEEDLHMIPTVELYIEHDEDRVFIIHPLTSTLVKELYLKDEEPLLAVKRGISNLTYQVYLRRLQQEKLVMQQDKHTSDILTDLATRVQKLEHALRMR